MRTRAIALAAFELAQAIAPTWPKGQLRLATEDDRGLLIAWSNRFVDEAGLPDRTGRLAVLESRVVCADALVAIALGTCSVLTR